MKPKNDICNVVLKTYSTDVTSQTFKILSKQGSPLLIQTKIVWAEIIVIIHVISACLIAVLEIHGNLHMKYFKI